VKTHPVNGSMIETDDLMMLWQHGPPMSPLIAELNANLMPDTCAAAEVRS
jgi:hypothetical protein